MLLKLVFENLCLTFVCMYALFDIEICVWTDFVDLTSIILQTSNTIAYIYAIVYIYIYALFHIYIYVWISFVIGGF